MRILNRNFDGSEFFLYCISIYVLILLNQHFNIPLKIAPFVLLIIGIAICLPSHDRLNAIAEARSNQLVLIAMIVFALVLCGTTIAKSSDTRELATAFLGPTALGILSGLRVTPSKALGVLSKAGVAALLFLAATDVLHYGRDLWLHGELPRDYSHRWFGDGYLFFLPWVLLARDCTQSRRNRWQLTCLIAVVFFLVAGVGSRGVWIAMVAEIVLMGLVLRRYAYLRDLGLFAIMLILGAITFSPEVTGSAFGRGLSDNQRALGMWEPGLDLIRQSPWFGHGFGRQAWDTAYYSALPSHPEWTVRMPFGGPHNLALQISFAGGLCALAAALALLATILYSLWLSLDSSIEVRPMPVAVLAALLGFYLLRGLVEDPRWEPLGLVLMWTIILQRASADPRSSWHH